MRLFDTARQSIVPFEPGPIVSMYVCGITPYDATHLGHAATYVTYDVLQRRLRDVGHETRMVRNITDVDDDMLRTARERGVHYLDLAYAETKKFVDDMDALGNIEPWSEPRASGAIPDIRGFIAALIETGCAYAAGGSVYFSVNCTEGRFGHLSRLDRGRMLEVGRRRGEDPNDPYKTNPLDFVLWRPSDVGEPAWESAWGPGRPGWHVECSVLALREFGETIDLHGGGTDLVFPHHECETAQSEATTGQIFVRHWLHQAMVMLDGKKMSKSRGNLVFVSTLRENYDPMVIRLALLAHHYRVSWEWDPAELDVAADRLERWRAAGSGESGLDETRLALDDDLNTPEALKAIDAAAASGAGVASAARLLGVSLETEHPVVAD